MKDMKMAKTFEEQVELLIDRNLEIMDKTEAEEFFSANNYYRVSAYFRPYYIKYNEELFKNGVTIEHIKNLYNFDSELRLLILPLIEKIEIAFRTHIAYYFAHNMGPMGYLEKDNFFDERVHFEFIKRIEEITRKPKDDFLKHYKNSYDRQYPIWVLVESLSFGNLSKFYSNMKNEDKSEICKLFYPKLKYKQLENWISGLVILRNICAHHGRVFNREIQMPQFKGYNFDIQKGYEKRIYSMFLIMKELIGPSDIWNDFVEKLQEIIRIYRFTHLQAMGFTKDCDKSFEVLAWQDPFFSDINQARLISAAADMNTGKDKIHELYELDNGNE